MGLMDRMGRVVRAQITQWVVQAEDPERLLEQTVQEMQDDLIQLRQAVAQAIATHKRTERQFIQAQAHADEWHRRAHLALHNGNEGLAREALAKRQFYLTTAKTLGEQLHQHRAVVTQIKQSTQHMELQLAEAKTKRDMYLARARSAQATSRLKERLTPDNPLGTAAVFERMEARVLELEAEAELIQERGRDRLTEQFRVLEEQQTIDQELEALRHQPPPASGITELNESAFRNSPS